jgi:hypothetical protein
MASMPDGQELCTRPGCTNPAASNHDWCKPCKAQYQREYNKTRDEMAFKRGFAAGVEAQRSDYVDHWLWFPGDYMVPCAEVAKVLREREKPVYTPKVTENVADA